MHMINSAGNISTINIYSCANPYNDPYIPAKLTKLIVLEN